MLEIKSVSKLERRKNWSVVINLGKPIKLENETILRSFDSGLFRETEIFGENLLVFDVNDDFEISDLQAEFFRKNWTPVYEIFPFDIFKDQDFFRSPKVKIDDLELNFWYCGENFSCGIHNEHDFFELHTQILGQGEMQKFHSDEEKTIFYRDILSPGQTHNPFYSKEKKYPFHQYKSRTKCLWLAIESPKKLVE